MKYTKGDWKVVGQNASLTIDAPEKIIAIVSYNYDSKANANLIASAPDLYEALKDARDYISARMPETLGKRDHLKIIDEVLAKAEGKDG